MPEKCTKMTSNDQKAMQKMDRRTTAIERSSTPINGKHLWKGNSGESSKQNGCTSAASHLRAVDGVDILICAAVMIRSSVKPAYRDENTHRDTETSMSSGRSCDSRWCANRRPFGISEDRSTSLCTVEQSDHTY
jgi:hypothetical protein